MAKRDTARMPAKPGTPSRKRGKREADTRGRVRRRSRRTRGSSRTRPAHAEQDEIRARPGAPAAPAELADEPVHAERPNASTNKPGEESMLDVARSATTCRRYMGSQCARWFGRRGGRGEVADLRGERRDRRRGGTCGSRWIRRYCTAIGPASTSTIGGCDRRTRRDARAVRPTTIRKQAAGEDHHDDHGQHTRRSSSR